MFVYPCIVAVNTLHSAIVWELLLVYIVIAVVGSFGFVAGLLHTSNLNNHLHVATYSVASYPGHVGGEKCFATTTWPRYEAMYIVNYLSSILYIPSDNT